MEKGRITTILCLIYLMSPPTTSASMPTLPPGFDIPMPSMYFNLTLPTLSTTIPYVTIFSTSTTTSSMATPTTLAQEAAETMHSGATTTTPATEPGASTPATTLPSEFPETHLPTINATPVCGSDMEVCYVEWDITGDDKYECCNNGNNPTCRLCLRPCSNICHSRGEGVKFCFGSDTAFGCECTKGKTPTCYTTTTSPDIVVSTTQAGIVDSVSSHTTLFYLLVLIATAIVLIAVFYYVRSL